jgi:hypothetical protein
MNITFEDTCNIFSMFVQIILEVDKQINYMNFSIWIHEHFIQDTNNLDTPSAVQSSLNLTPTTRSMEQREYCIYEQENNFSSSLYNYLNYFCIRFTKYF